MKALIAMSGGVDSSVAALAIKQKGIECIGCTMKLFEDAGDEYKDAEAVASGLGMSFYVFDYMMEFRKDVMESFASVYEAGATPNPCVECNKKLKFGKLYDKALELGCEFLVTGHYARISSEDGRFYLRKALDKSKDQSYVLYGLTQEKLAHILMPLGELTKQEARRIAEVNGFVNHDKPDSQDICFVPDGDYKSAVKRITGNESVPGDFVDRDGRVLGRHKGIVNYTIGQRKGLGIAAGHPIFVCEICAGDNTVMLGENEDLMKREVMVRDFNWISGEVPDGPVICSAKTRYRMKDEPATAFPLSDGRVRIIFDEPQRAITPGQSAVIYEGDTVLGGGIIV